MVTLIRCSKPSFLQGLRPVRRWRAYRSQALREHLEPRLRSAFDVPGRDTWPEGAHIRSWRARPGRSRAWRTVSRVRQRSPPDITRRTEHGETTGDRGVAHEGEDPGAVPGLRLLRDGEQGSRARSPREGHGRG